MGHQKPKVCAIYNGQQTIDNQHLRGGEKLATQRKIESVADLTDKLTRTQLTVVTDYRGLTVGEITDLRKKLRETGADLIVAKNTLTLRAAKDTGYDGLEPLLSGPNCRGRRGPGVRRGRRAQRGDYQCPVCLAGANRSVAARRRAGGLKRET